MIIGAVELCLRSFEKLQYLQAAPCWRWRLLIRRNHHYLRPTIIHPRKSVLKSRRESSGPLLGGRKKSVKRGKIIVPPGTIHQMQNVAIEPAQVIWHTKPALRAVEGNPRNAEIQLAMSSEEDAGRLQKAFLDAGGQVEDPAEVLMFEPVKIYPLVDPFGTNLLLSSGILTTTCRIIGILASHIRLETNSIW